MCGPTQSMLALGQAMRSAREHLGRSQFAVAHRMGRTRESLSAFERGRTLPPPAAWSLWLEAVRHDAARDRDAPWLAAFEALLAQAAACYRRAAAEAEALRERQGLHGAQPPAPSTEPRDPVTRYEASPSVTLRGDLSGSDDEEPPTNRRQALAAAGSVTTAMVLETVEESRRLSRAGELSDLGPVTLEHLDLAIQRFGETYLTTPLDQMFAQVRATRAEVVRLLEQRHTLSQKRHLYVLLGWLSGLLGETSFGMGNHAAGRAHCVTALQFAKEAGHNGITAWIRGRQAVIETYAGRAAEAINCAQAGQRLAKPGSGIAVRLAALETRAAGLLGDRQRAEEALRRAKKAAEALDGTPPTGGIMSGTAHDPHYYGATAYVRLGQPKRAREEARLALDMCGADPGRWPSDRAVSHLDLAAAAVMLGDPAEACREGGEALDIYVNERQTGVILLRAGELHRSLARFGADPAVRDFGERLQTLVAA